MQAPPATAAPGLRTIEALLVAYAERTNVQKVAVVGNAPIAPSAERAEEIDSADLVIRVNSFVLDGDSDPPTQGRKAHCVVFNRNLVATPLSFEGYRDRLFLLSEAAQIYVGRRRFQRHIVEWPVWWPPDLGCVAVPNSAFTIPLLEEMRVPWREQTVIPTTGTLAVYIARTCFPAADLVIAGFSMLDHPHQKEWRHQWGDKSPVGPSHWLAEEGAMLERWIAEGRLRLHK